MNGFIDRISVIFKSGKVIPIFVVHF